MLGRWDGILEILSIYEICHRHKNIKSMKIGISPIVARGSSEKAIAANVIEMQF